MAKILVIDDDSEIRGLLKSFLEREGHQLTLLPDGALSLEAQRRNNFDLLITDIIMPEKEGIETILDIKREFPEMKIIAISGGGIVGPQEYLREAERLGADHTLVKPFGMNDLRDIVNKLLEE